MGASNSVAIKAAPLALEEGEEDVESMLQAIFADSDRMTELFKEICVSAEQDRINIHNKISCANLYYYHSSDKNPIFTKLILNQLILKEAHNFACSKKSRTKALPQVTRGRFKTLLCAIYYFSHLWRVFSTLDCIVVDNKLHKGELLKIQILVNSIAGVELTLKEDLKKEEVEDQFIAMDKDKSGSITFDEFVIWCLEHVSKPRCFSDDLINAKDDDNSDHEDEFDVDEKIIDKMMHRNFMSAGDAVLMMEKKLEAEKLQKDSTSTTATNEAPQKVAGEAEDAQCVKAPLRTYSLEGTMDYTVPTPVEQVTPVKVVVGGAQKACPSTV